MIPAADVIPDTPNGAKSERLSEFQPLTPTTTNSASTPSLIRTITALTFADSLAPRISSSVHRTTRTMAGRLMMASASGAFDSECGMVKPKTLSSSSLRYCDQPTATAAAETPYSSSREAATTMATPSRSVQYAYEYEEPKTGTVLASSA